MRQRGKIALFAVLPDGILAGIQQIAAAPGWTEREASWASLRGALCRRSARLGSPFCEKIFFFRG